jgi:hypothetical protein
MTDQSGLTSPPQGLTPWAFGEAFFNERKLVHELVEKTVMPVARRPFRTVAEKLFSELYQRVYAWVLSLERLANANDFQPVAACTRAMFEAAIDFTLLHFAKAAHPPEKMLAWDEHAKLVSCQKIKRHFDKRGGAAHRLVRAGGHYRREHKSERDGAKRFEPTCVRCDRKPRFPTRRVP